MKFEFGKTAEAHKTYLEDWHQFYPYWPREVGPFDFRAFEWIERRGTWTRGFVQGKGKGDYFYWKWEYRSLDIPSGVES